LKTSDFYFDLPQELIAQYPSEKRGSSRLLVFKRNTGEIIHSFIKDFTDFTDSNSIIVFNNTRVRKARLYGSSLSGGNTEFLLLNQLSSAAWSALCSKSKKQIPGKKYLFPGNVAGIITRIEDEKRIIEFIPPIDDLYLEKYGHIPLPPYIKREDISSDAERYQTIYSEKTGSSAAPTAGLHFTEEILQHIRDKQIQTCFITLHVGMGTFQPIRTELIQNHIIHEEHYEISEETAFIINKAKKSGKKIIAVGTTSLRAIESSSVNGKVIPGNNSTNLFIYPGYNFQIIDHLFTNFHTPSSTLLLLVSAFTGQERIKNIYQNAISNKYKFFSYGDAMFIL
jgi:S-adenosylmethionine:tRNA ribosyltransferase-isomerase